MFLPLTGIPMRKRARTRTLLAVWLPDPLTVAATMQKLLTPAGLSWRSVTSGPLCTLVVLMKPVATPAPEPPGADVAPPFARRSAHIADCFCCLSHPRAQVDTQPHAGMRALAASGRHPGQLSVSVVALNISPSAAASPVYYSAHKAAGVCEICPANSASQRLNRIHVE